MQVKELIEELQKFQQYYSIGFTVYKDGIPFSLAFYAFTQQYDTIRIDLIDRVLLYRENE